MIFMRPEKFNLVGVIDRASRVTEPGRVCACVCVCMRACAFLFQIFFIFLRLTTNLLIIHLRICTHKAQLSPAVRACARTHTYTHTHFCNKMAVADYRGFQKVVISDYRGWSS